MRYTVTNLLVLASLSSTAASAPHRALRPYLDTISGKGSDPIEFVTEVLEDQDLVMFDDALHTAVDPWDYYAQLIRSPKINQDVKYLFVEVLPLNYQYAIDVYLDSEPEDRTLLLPALQNGITGTGLENKIDTDFRHTVYEVNQTLPKDQRIRVVGVASHVTI